MKRADVVDRMLPNRQPPVQESAEAFAPVNIALCKYWGKRDEELNLPVTDSLSISLGELGARTRIAAVPRCDERLILNGQTLPADHAAVQRVSRFLDLFRIHEDSGYAVESESSVPVAAGLASSASGFAALVLALDALHGWQLSREDLSVLARLGSGSACRSVYQGFVHWSAGLRDDGLDSFARPLDAIWPDLRVGLVMVSDAAKPVSSRAGMRQTVETSALYRVWPEKVDETMRELMAALAAGNFEQLGEAAESNALAMHATMMDTRPPVLYWQPGTVTTLHRVFQLRADGVPVYATMDAGPNVKLLFHADAADAVRRVFADMRVAVPFARPV